MSTPSDDNIRALWQSQPATQPAISIEDLRERARTFQARIRRRNRIEYIAAAVVIAAFGWYATWSKPATILWPIANIMLIVGALTIVFILHRHGRAAPANLTAPGLNASAASLMDFHRAELVRQRKLLRTVWLWYIMPFVPGLILWLIAIWIGRNPAKPEIPLLIGIIATAALATLTFAMVIVLNLRGAARLQRQIDDIDSYKEKT